MKLFGLTKMCLNETYSKVRIGKYSCDMKNGVFWDVTPCGSCKNRRRDLAPPSG
jgi:hypothetical protein